jgi:hypothetical protein
VWIIIRKDDILVCGLLKIYLFYAPHTYSRFHPLHTFTTVINIHLLQNPSSTNSITDVLLLLNCWKRLGHEMKNFFKGLRILLSRYFLYIRWWVSKLFDASLLKKSKSKIMLFASKKLLTNFEHPFNNPLQRPYSSDFDPENAYRKPHVIL